MNERAGVLRPAATPPTIAPWVLVFTDRAVELRDAEAAGAEPVAIAPLGEDGQPRDVHRLRQAAGADPQVVIWLPPEQTCTLHPRLPRAGDRRAAALAAAAATTGLRVEELAVGVGPDEGGRAEVVVAMAQTVHEAHAYATGWGFEPVAVTVPGRIDGAPDLAAAIAPTTAQTATPAPAAPARPRPRVGTGIYEAPARRSERPRDEGAGLDLRRLGSAHAEDAPAPPRPTPPPAESVEHDPTMRRFGAAVAGAVAMPDRTGVGAPLEPKARDRATPPSPEADTSPTPREDTPVAASPDGPAAAARPPAGTAATAERRPGRGGAILAGAVALAIALVVGAVLLPTEDGPTAPTAVPPVAEAPPTDDLATGAPALAPSNGTTMATPPGSGATETVGIEPTATPAPRPPSASRLDTAAPRGLGPRDPAPVLAALGDGARLIVPAPPAARGPVPPRPAADGVTDAVPVETTAAGGAVGAADAPVPLPRPTTLDTGASDPPASTEEADDAGTALTGDGGTALTGDGGEPWTGPPLPLGRPASIAERVSRPRLVGIMRLDGRQQALLQFPDGRTRRVTVGDAVGDWRVATIDAAGIRLVSEEGEDRTLGIGER